MKLRHSAVELLKDDANVLEVNTVQLDIQTDSS